MRIVLALYLALIFFHCVSVGLLAGMAFHGFAYYRLNLSYHVRRDVDQFCILDFNRAASR